MSRLPIEFKKGLTVRPKEILPSGEVIFTDGTTDMRGNQVDCEAYGYTYNTATRTCQAFPFSTKVGKAITNETNVVKGKGNTTELGTQGCFIMGENNSTKGLNRNSIISGVKNEIANNVSNVTALGVNANATRQAQFVIGGGLNNIITSGLSVYGDRQVSIVNLSGTTEDNSTTNLTVNNEADQYINVKNNCILGYEIYLTRLELGGSSGTKGNFSYRNEKGVVRIDNSYGMTFTVGFTRNIGKLGVNGTYAMADVSTSDVKAITIQVSDRNNVDNIWSATVYLHELVSTNVTF
tara:strand:+ start:5604 stop:6485 length:882 start_codon:yes stop_codon:yes gene_type:complete